MTPGLPGAGIGGLLYLLAGLFAPVWETIRIIRGNAAPRRWALVLRLFLLALSITAAMWLTASIIVAVFSMSVAANAGSTASSVAAMPVVIGRRMALLTLTTLVLVLMGVELLALVSRAIRRTSRSQSAGRSPAVESPDDLSLRALGGE